MKLGELRKYAPLLVALMLLLAAWFGWGGYVQWRHEARLARIEKLRTQAVESFSGALAEQTKRLDSVLKQGPVAAALASGDAAAVTAEVRKQINNAESIELFPADLSPVYRQAAQFGYARLGLLESALAKPEVQVLVVHDAGKPSLGIAARVTMAGAPTLLYLRLPLQRLTTAIDKVALPGWAFMALRQGNYSVVEKGDGELADRSESLAQSLGQTGLRVAVGIPDAESGPLDLGVLSCSVVAVLMLLGSGLTVFVMSRWTELGKRKVVVVDEDDPTLNQLVHQSPQYPPAVDLRVTSTVEPSADADVPIDATIFRASDIRGVAGRQLNANVAAQIGKAIGSRIRADGLNDVVVGCDSRVSSPELVVALIEGLRSTGCDVVELGMMPTPVAYFACQQLHISNCVVVTASHTPAQYNGFRIMIGGQALVGERITDLYQCIAEGRLHVAAEPGGLSSAPEIVADYISRITSDIQLKRPLKIVADAGNGAASDIAPRLFEALGAEVTPLYCDVDGSFPNHEPDPAHPGNLKDLVQTVKRFDADLGVAFDGDADCLAVVTREGRIIHADRLLMLFASDVLQRNPGALIIYDINCTGRLSRHVVGSGGSALMWKANGASIRAKMRETGAELAGDINGHFYFRERWYGFDDGLYAAARLLEILAQQEQSPSEVLNALPESFATPEIKLPLAIPAQTLVEQFSATVQLGLPGFENARISTVDGLRIDFVDGWGLVRSSRTAAALLILRFEGESPDALKRIRGLFREQLQTLLPGQAFEF